MSQDFRLYNSAEVWDQEIQIGQQNLLRALRDFWPEGVSTALDVGCGDGKLTRVLAAETAVQIVGFDNSAEALSRLPLSSVQGDAAAMPFEDGSFDLVFSTDTLEHVPDPAHDSVWSEIFRVARHHVMVAVPFREELLDATALCPQCGNTYHVNWHQRSYDIDDLRRRVAPGWHVKACVATGAAWPDMLPKETQLRRLGMGQWSGWSMAVCPHCGAPGHEPSAHLQLPALSAAALGRQIYASLRQRRVWRSHSEILCIYGRSPARAAPSLLRPALQDRPASQVAPSQQEIHDQLVSYPQVARCVQSAKGGLIIQFPAYDACLDLRVRRAAGSYAPLDASLEDGFGLLFSGTLLAAGQPEAAIRLERQPVAGAYGILLRTRAAETIGLASLGEAPEVTWAAPAEKHGPAYHLADQAEGAIWVQVTRPTWLDASFWQPHEAGEGAGLSSLLSGIEQLAEQQQTVVGERLRQVLAEVEVARVDIQNLCAEREALLQRAREADRLAVEVQNLRAEREALLQRAREADRLAVEVQNLRAEREALLQRAREADRLAVEVQNLRAEREALLQRAREADRLAVEVQNLRAEREAFDHRVEAADALGVRLQQSLNVSAEEIQRLQQALQVLRAEYSVCSATLDAVRARAEYKLGEAVRRHLRKNQTSDR